MATLNDTPTSFDPTRESKSRELFERACTVMPRGNSRHSVFFAPHPIYCLSATGCRVTDVDGVERLDFVNNYSSLVHGHGHPAVLAAIREQLELVIAVGLPTELEITLAEHLSGRVKSAEQLRFTNSGTEAVMMAMKAARAVTGRPVIAKFEGCYHGTYDPAEVSQAPHAPSWGPADAPASVPLSKGTPAGLYDDMLVLPFNELEATEQLLRAHASQIAGILIDLAPAHLGYLPVEPEIISLLRRFCDEDGALLIIDEVYSLRFDYHGAQHLFGVRADITVMGKIIGGGLPVGAVGASRSIMAVFDPLPDGPSVVHGGTYNANPLTMAAGLASMEALGQSEIAKMAEMGEQLRDGLEKAAARHGIDAVIGGLGSVASITFGRGPLRNYRDRERLTEHSRLVAQFHRAMLDQGVLIAAQGLAVLSTVMEGADVQLFLRASDAAFRRLA